MSPVTCHMSNVIIFFSFLFYKVVKLVGGGSVINGAYPVEFSNDGQQIMMGMRMRMRMVGG